MASDKLPPPESLLPKAKLTLLGMYKNDQPEVLTYELVLVKLENGRVTGVESLDTCYSDSDAINAATSWIDANYYDT